MTDDQLYKNAIETLALAIVSECHLCEDLKLLVSLLGIKQKSGNEIEQIVKSVIENNKEKVEEYKSGKTKLIGYFVGQVMKNMKSADPKIVNEMFAEKLK